MVFNRFRIVVFGRVFFILITGLILFLLTHKTNYFFTPIIFTILIVIQTIGLIQYVELTNKKISRFLESIRYADFNAAYADAKADKTFRDLNQSFNEVFNEYRKIRASEAEQHHYLKTVVRHVNNGIIVFSKDGKINLINDAAQSFFKIGSIENIMDISIVDKTLARLFINMKSGDRELYKMVHNGEIKQLSIHAASFRMRGKEFVLVNFQNIFNELEDNEIFAWQQLTRVLTHEIMNSITPILSLTDTMNDMISENVELSQRKDHNAEPEAWSEIAVAIKSINKRSKGLMHFVETYRSLTRIPKPVFKRFAVVELFESIAALLKPKLSEKSIDFYYQISPDNLQLTADPDLIEQVMINLITNSIQALQESSSPKIELFAKQVYTNKVNIIVKDNGQGIKPDVIDKIFVPFFTSKKEGSGIGLSLSRQIMRLHKGTIVVKSEPEQETQFILKF